MEIKSNSNNESLATTLDILNTNNLIAIASRPGMGKSTLALNIINNTAKETKDKILYFNLETSINTLKNKITNTNVEIIDTPQITVEEIKSKCEETSKNRLALVVIDYLQLISTTTSHNNKNEEMSYISRTLKTIALELNIPVIVLSQISRQLENREDKRPILRDLDIGSSLTQDADKVIFLYKESYYDKEHKENDIELIVAKNCNGKTRTIKLHYDTTTNTFR